MKQRRQFVFVLFVAALIFPITARADTDGDFCISRGYVAYSLRQGLTAGIVGQKLRLVKVEPGRGIVRAGDATLLDFEVYHMICSENRIEISGWRKVFTKYVIDILPSGEMKVSGPVNYPNLGWREAANDGPTPLSLNIFGPKADPLLVESPDTEHRYRLLRNLAEKPSKQGFEWHIKSELVQIDKKGKVSQRFVLYERTRIEFRD
jgi:hypothetical protein